MTETLEARLRVEIDDLRGVVDHEFARLAKQLSHDVSLAYAELKAERGNVRPLDELRRRRELHPLPPDHPLAQRRDWDRDEFGRVI